MKSSKYISKIQKIFESPISIKRHKLAIVFIAAILTIVLVQALYPTDKLVLFTTYNGTDYGGWQKSDAIKDLNDKYQQLSLDIEYGDPTILIKNTTLGDVGILADTSFAVNSQDYPWYLRVIPTSILWAHYFIDNDDKQPIYSIDKTRVDDYSVANCKIDAVDAGLLFNGVQLEVVDSKNGAVCDAGDLSSAISAFRLAFNEINIIKVAAKPVSPIITNEKAEKERSAILEETKSGVVLAYGGQTLELKQSDLVGWMSFDVNDGTLAHHIDEQKAIEDLNRDYIILTNGVYQSIIATSSDGLISQVDTLDKGLDVKSTLANIKAAMSGNGIAEVATNAIIAANYAGDFDGIPVDNDVSNAINSYIDSLPGRYGVEIVDLSNGNIIKAGANQDMSFTAASTYKLFVAYSTLKRIESGAWHWTDSSALGYSLDTCFDRMIMYSDNDCAVNMLTKISYQTVTDEAQALGCDSTVFSHADGIRTTPHDLALLLTKLQLGQLLTQQSSRDKLFNAMKDDIYRSGIPSGISGAVVANKVGFLDALLHDASIVYDGDKTYVLIVMTEYSSWANIANVASKVASLQPAMQ